MASTVVLAPIAWWGMWRLSLNRVTYSAKHGEIRE
jgi:hypothetical protein